MTERLSRRKYIAVAGAAAAAAVIGGAAYYLSQPSPPTPTSTPKPTAMPTPTATPKPTGKVKLRFWDTVNVQSEQAKQFVETKVEEFRKLHPEVDFEVEYLPMGTGEKVTAAVQAGTYPHIIQTHMAAAGADFVVPGVAVPLNEFLDDWEVTSLMKDSLDNILRAMGPYCPNGEIWILPWGGEVLQVIALRADHWEEAGLDPDKDYPRSWPELVEVAKQLTRDVDGDGKIDRWGFELCGVTGDIADCTNEALSVAYAEKSRYISDDWQEVWVNSDESVDILQFQLDMLYKHKVASSKSLTESDEGICERLIEGNVSMGLIAYLNIGIFMDRAPEMLKDGRILIKPCPKWNMPYICTTNYYALCMLEPPGMTDRQKELAFEFMKLYLTPESQKFVGYNMGWVPVRKDVRDELISAGEPEHLVAAAESFKNGFARPCPPAFTELYYEIHPKHLQRAFAKEVPPLEALNDSAEEQVKLLQKYGYAKKGHARDNL